MRLLIQLLSCPVFVRSLPLLKLLHRVVSAAIPVDESRAVAAQPDAVLSGCSVIGGRPIVVSWASGRSRRDVGSLTYANELVPPCAAGATVTARQVGFEQTYAARIASARFVDSLNSSRDATAIPHMRWTACYAIRRQVFEQAAPDSSRVGCAPRLG